MPIGRGNGGSSVFFICVAPRTLERGRRRRLCCGLERQNRTKPLPGLRKFESVTHPLNPHTLLKTSPQERLDQGGNEWDTIKPLAAHFRGDASHVVLVDNDAHKAADGEEGNMVVVPTWDGPTGSGEEHDGVLAALVDALLDPAVGLASSSTPPPTPTSANAAAPPVVDVRPKTAAVTARVASGAPALAVKERAAALEAAQSAAAAAVAALPQPPQPSASAKRAAKRAAKEAAATAVTALGEAVLVLSSSDDSGSESEGDEDDNAEEDKEALASDLPPEPVLPETLAAWKTAVLATVGELTTAGAVDLPTVMAYCRHRATSGELKNLLNRKALRTALNSAVKQSKKSGGGGKKNKASPAAASSGDAAAAAPPPLVLSAKPDGARGVSGKIISKCFAVNPDAVATLASFDEALEALSKVLGGKKTSSGTGGGGQGSNNNKSVGVGGAVVAEAIKAVAVASVADLTVGGSPLAAK